MVRQIGVGFAFCCAVLLAPAVGMADQPRPWDSAQAALTATSADVQARGVLAVQPHIADLEAALADADQAFAATPSDQPVAYVLTDGPTETLMALAGAAEAANKGVGSARKVVAVANPYPMISLLLGSYYNEIGKPEEAVRVLDRGASLTAIKGLQMGAHLPYLISERGAALVVLKRWPEALANDDQGLAIAALTPHERAMLLRGRGFALTELGRLDDAEKSYRDSLVAEPGNARALSELTYIAGLRRGERRRETKIDLPNAETH